jgi:hypothetical protein
MYRERGIGTLMVTCDDADRLGVKESVPSHIRSRD